MNDNIVIFIHCFAVNNWDELLQAQLERLKNSGLYEAAHQIELSLTDPDDLYQSTVTHLLENYSKVELHHTTRNWHEATTLDRLDKFARSDISNSKILYFHVKGVSNTYKIFGDVQPYSLKTDGIRCWTNLLEYFLIDKWNTCVDLLNTYETVGVTNNGNWWWGNFWWTTSDYIKSIMPFNDFYGGSRWQAEAWLHEAHPNKNTIKYHEMYRFQYDPYYTIIPSYFYDGTDLSNLEIIVEKAQYGYFAEQRDEGRGVLREEDQVTDVTDIIKRHVTKSNNQRLEFITENNSLIFSYETLCGGDPAFGYPKLLRIWFRTNIDSENQYVLSTFLDWSIQLGNLT